MLEDTIIHPSEKFAITNTKLGWTVGGNTPKDLLAEWQRIHPNFHIKKILSSTTNTKMITPKEENSNLEKVLLKLFNKEEEMKEEGIYTPDETYALESFIKNIKQEADGRYTVSPLLRPEHLPLRNNYFLALQRYRGLLKSLEKDEIKPKIYSDAINQMIKMVKLKK